MEKKYNWSKKQIKALKKIFLLKHIDVFKIKGSWAGAFGLPQFIPTTFIDYAVDGNDDKKIDIFTMPDSIFSIANYFNKHGWKEEASIKNKEKVVFAYNHSRLYSDTVIRLAKIFKDRLLDIHNFE